jgi:hypothetical protein
LAGFTGGTLDAGGAVTPSRFSMVATATFARAHGSLSLVSIALALVLLPARSSSRSWNIIERH